MVFAAPTLHFKRGKAQIRSVQMPAMRKLQCSDDYQANGGFGSFASS